MARIWFLKNGELQAAGSVEGKSLDWCVAHLSLKPADWVANLRIKSQNQREQVETEFTPYNGFHFAIVELTREESETYPGWKPGFHVLQMDGREATEILDQ